MMMCIAEHLTRLCLFWIIVCVRPSVSQFGEETKDICANPSGTIRYDGDGDKIWEFKMVTKSNFQWEFATNGECEYKNIESVLVLHLLPYNLKLYYNNSDETRICYSGLYYKQEGDKYAHRFCVEVSNTLRIFATDKFPFRLSYDAYSNSKFVIYYTVINKGTVYSGFPGLILPSYLYNIMETTTTKPIQQGNENKKMDLCSKPTGVLKYETEGEAVWKFDRTGCNSDKAILILHLVPSNLFHHYYTNGRYCYVTLSYGKPSDLSASRFCTRVVNSLQVWSTNEFPVELKYSSLYHHSFTIFYTVIDNVIDNGIEKDANPIATTSLTTQESNTTTSSTATTHEGSLSSDRTLSITFGILFAITIIVLGILVFRTCYSKRIQTDSRNLIRD